MIIKVNNTYPSVRIKSNLTCKVAALYSNASLKSPDPHEKLRLHYYYTLEMFLYYISPR